MDKYKRLMASWKEAQQRRDEEDLRACYTIAETDNGFYIRCNSIGVMRFGSDATLQEVRTQLESLRQTAVEFSKEYKQR